ncbi:MAG: roadblock/LC7 domain-containing protein [Gemmatirosa sp.]|nr:roadblock/LC7 domain-containing protein [Gemmatirosa sp.]
MPAIRDLIRALRNRPGVDAAVVAGRDGLVIDAESDVDAERVAAHLPALIVAADDLGRALDRGALATLVVEHERGGLAVISALTPDVLLLVLLDPAADVGPLLGELRRDRARLGTLV